MEKNFYDYDVDYVNVYFEGELYVTNSVDSYSGLYALAIDEWKYMIEHELKYRNFTNIGISIMDIEIDINSFIQFEGSCALKTTEWTNLMDSALLRSIKMAFNSISEDYNWCYGLVFNVIQFTPHCISKEKDIPESTKRLREHEELTHNTGPEGIKYASSRYPYGDPRNKYARDIIPYLTRYLERLVHDFGLVYVGYPEFMSKLGVGKYHVKQALSYLVNVNHFNLYTMVLDKDGRKHTIQVLCVPEIEKKDILKYRKKNLIFRPNLEHYNDFCLTKQIEKIETNEEE